MAVAEAKYFDFYGVASFQQIPSFLILSVIFAEVFFLSENKNGPDLLGEFVNSTS